MGGLVITSARVDTTDGCVAATIDLIEVGGGTQIVTVDGHPEERIHPAKQVFHLRLISPDRMIPDELREVDSYGAAVSLGERYAAKLTANRSRIAELAADLQV